MASIRSVVFFAFAAVAVQSAVAWDFNLPGLFGSSFGISSLSGSRRFGGNVAMENNAAVATVEMGPLGGFQSKLVAPVLPNFPDIMRMANDNMARIVASIGDRFGMFGGMIHDAIDVQIKAFEMILSSVAGNLADLARNAGGLMKMVIDSGMVNMGKIREFTAAIVKSAMNNTLNAGAVFIDLLQKAIKMKLVMDGQAIVLVRDAIEAGLHKAEGAVDVTINAFLDNAAAAGRISNDLAERLKELLKNSAADLNANAGANANAGTNANAGMNGNAGTNANAGMNGNAGTNANAGTTGNPGANNGAGFNAGISVNA